MTHNTTALRQFLMQTFDDEELTDFCFDYFPGVLEDFTTGMRKTQKVRLLITYCQGRGRLADLLAALERERPQPYQAQFASVLADESTAAPPASPPQRDPRRVFIGYAHQDADFSRRLADDLEANGYPVWLAPDSIRPGEKWAEAVNRGLEESGVFVLVLTPAAVNSRWVHSEANAAIDLEHQAELAFIPLLVQACRVPPLWRAYQRITFRAGYEAGLNALLLRLEAGGAPVTALTPQRVWPRQAEQLPHVSTPAADTIRDTLVWDRDSKEMVRVPAGGFLYGPERAAVYLFEFWIDKTPVTNAEYARFVAATGHRRPAHWLTDRPPAEIATHPVVNVSWLDAAAYGRWAGKGLPTAEQWEKAARGSDGRPYPWGNRPPTAELGNFGLTTRGTTPVGLYSPQGDSPYGCTDLCGNVWEWTSTWDSDLKKYRLLCGGSWSLAFQKVSVTARHRNLPHFRYFNLGFRLVFPPPLELD